MLAEVVFSLFICVCIGACFSTSNSKPLSLRWCFVGSIVWGYCAFVIFAPYHLSIAYFESDFVDYCVAILHFDDLDTGYPSKRSRFAATLPSFLSGYVGVLDALSLTAVGMSIVMTFGLCLWANQLGGRIAAYTALMLSLSMTPLVAMTRYLTFYPMIISILVWAGFFFTLAFQKPNIKSYFMAGVMIAACILIDTRGIMWGGWFGFVLVCNCLVLGLDWVQKVRYLLGLFLPIWMSWFVGWWAYRPYSLSLAEMLDVLPLFAAFEPQNPLYQQASARIQPFIWGYGGDFLAMIQMIISQLFIEAPQDLILHRSSETLFWSALSIFALFILWVRIPKRDYWALVLAIVPFAVSLWGAMHLVETHIRFPAHGLPMVAVILSLLVASSRRASGPTMPTFGCVVLWGLIVWGYVPSTLSPRASWREKPQVQRTILFKLLKQTFPHAGYDKPGAELHQIPNIIEERVNARYWPEECIERLRNDGDVHPWPYRN